MIEIKWRLKEQSVGAAAGAPMAVDPGYPISVGLLFERIRGEFPHIEELPVTAVPDQMTPHMVKYRFRAQPNGWPCVQLGPGVATVNFTTEYNWQRFRDAVSRFAPNLTAAYAASGAPLVPISVVLRYINAVPFNPDEVDVLEFVSTRLNFSIALPQEVQRFPHRRGPAESLVLRVGLPLTRPVGVGYVQIGTGKRDGSPAIVWDLSLASTNADAPRLDAGFEDWLAQAHEVIESWFFTLIAGELEERFRANA